VGHTSIYLSYFFKAMRQLARSSAFLSVLLGVLVFSNAACTPQPQAKPPEAKSIARPSPSPKVAKKPKAKPTADPRYKLALDKAESAKSISQSAQSPEDWNLVVSRWQEAVKLLKQLPTKDPHKKLANQKLADFQASLATAQTRASRSGKEQVATLDPGIVVDAPISEGGTAAPETTGIHQAMIKYRQSRIPVIGVIFNGSQQFDMMVDTGASGTMITPDMADALNVEIVGSATAMTPAGPTELDIGLIKSIRVGGRIVRNVQVSIGPVRLLGHDFFGNCDLSIKQNVVEFGQCG
jgi:predicted aspartyl protease